MEELIEIIEKRPQIRNPLLVLPTPVRANVATLTRMHQMHSLHLAKLLKSSEPCFPRCLASLRFAHHHHPKSFIFSKPKLSSLPSSGAARARDQERRSHTGQTFRRHATTYIFSQQIKLFLIYFLLHITTVRGLVKGIRSKKARWTSCTCRTCIAIGGGSISSRPGFAPGTLTLGDWAIGPGEWFNAGLLCHCLWLLIPYAGVLWWAFIWLQSRVRDGATYRRDSGSVCDGGRYQYYEMVIFQNRTKDTVFELAFEEHLLGPALMYEDMLWMS